MDRRRDFRHPLEYRFSMKCPRSGRVMDDLVTEEVSASGLQFRSLMPHGLDYGDRFEVQLFAKVDGNVHQDLLVMATHGTIVWAEDRAGALRFEAPLAF